jgi:hypothetical protein
MMVFFIVMIIHGCSSGYITQSEYDKVCKQRDDLLKENAQLIEDSALVHARIEGAFVATVRDLIPNYTLDNTTPNCAILTCFQCGPFILEVGEDMASQLEKGETYLFQIQAKDIGEITQTDFDAGPSLVLAMHLYNISISDFRVADESETGLSSPNLTYQRIQED